MNPLLWLTSPLIGAVIGYVTNTIAVTMLFRPHEPKRFGPLRIHGLIPKRQQELSRKIGEVVGQHLVGHEDLVRSLEGLDFEEMLGGLLDRALEGKLAEYRAMPLVGAFLTPERVESLKAAIVQSVLEHREELLGALEGAIEESLDVREVVEKKVQEFSTRKMEEIVLSVARRELRAIEVWGAILGAVIGLLQAALATAMLG